MQKEAFLTYDPFWAFASWLMADFYPLSQRPGIDIHAYTKYIYTQKWILTFWGPFYQYSLGQWHRVLDPKACLVLVESIQPRRHNFHNNKEIFTPSPNGLINYRYLFWRYPLILSYHSFFFFFFWLCHSVPWPGIEPGFLSSESALITRPSGNSLIHSLKSNLIEKIIF